jgi:hypothetical protein
MKFLLLNAKEYNLLSLQCNNLCRPCAWANEP